MTPSSHTPHQRLAKNSHTITNSNDKSEKKPSIINSPRINSKAKEKQLELPDSQEIIKELHIAIANLQKERIPQFTTLENVCEQLKNAEEILIPASSKNEMNKAFDQLRSQLPQFFKKIQQYIAILEAQGVTLDTDSIHTICIGLSALANPLNGNFFTPEQSAKHQEILTEISAYFCDLLNKPIQHGSLPSGKLLNILNWYSRGMKSDLINSNNKQIKQTFQLTLSRLQNWANGVGDDGWLNSKQLSKCMVQLNTMIKLRIINIENNAEGKSNRLAWSETVKSLCEYFLSNQVWLDSCNIVELTNVTNTIKEGIDKNLLPIDEAIINKAINCICNRIIGQSFTIKNRKELNSFTNCCNFIRCLYEHNAVGDLTSMRGLAMMKLVDTLANYKSNEITIGDPQANINTASFIKSADRWIQAQENCNRFPSKQELVITVHAVIKNCENLCQRENPAWLASPASNSGLLSAFDYFLQRKLISKDAESGLIFILRTIFDNTNNWRQQDIGNASLLLVLRTLISLESYSTIFLSLQKSGSVKRALPTLLDYLNNNTKNKVLNFRNEENLSVLQTIRLGIKLDFISINSYQDLLKALLKTADTVNIEQLESAIIQCNGTLNQPIIVEIEEHITNQNENDHLPSISTPLSTVKRGPTYRGQASEKQNSKINVTKEKSTMQEQVWIDIPIKSTQQPHISNPSKEKNYQLPIENATSIPIIKTRKEKINLENKSSDQKFTGHIEPQINKIKQPLNTLSNQPINFQQAKITWFNLLKSEKNNTLKEIQKLAEIYPELIALRQESKKGNPGSNAMFYAITMGKIELALWLTKQSNPIAGQEFGDFIESINNEIQFIESRHEQAMHHFVASQVKRAASNGHLLMMHPMQSFVITKNPKIKNILDKYELLSYFKFALADMILKNYRINNPNKKIKDSSSTLSDAMSLENFEINDYMAEKNTAGNVFLESILIESTLEEIEFALSLTKDKNKLINEIIPNHQILFYAIDHLSKKKLAVISLLLNSVKDKDTLIYASNSSGMNTLSYAIEYNLSEVVGLLLDHVSDPDHLAYTSRYAELTSLMHAIETGNKKNIKALLSRVKDKKALAQLADAKGNTALMFAVKNKRTAEIKFLLKEVPDSDELLTQKNIQGETAYDIALDNNYLSILEVLKPSNRRQNFKLAISQSDINSASPFGLAFFEQLQKITTHEKSSFKFESNVTFPTAVNVSEKEKLDSTSLDIIKYHEIFCGAINENLIPAVTKMINQSSNVENLVHMKNANGATPLMLAVQKNNIAVVELLLAATNYKELLIFATSHDGINAFMLAVQNGNDYVASILLNAVNNIDELLYAELADGTNALMLAVKYSKPTMIKLILENVSNPDHLAQKKTHSGLTCLMIAAGLGDEICLHHILNGVKDKSTLVKKSDAQGKTANIYATEEGHLNIIKLLLAPLTYSRVLLNQTTHAGESPITIANKKSLLSMTKVVEPHYIKFKL